MMKVVDAFGNDAGNSLWDYWNQKDFCEMWGDDCMHYSDNYISPPNHQTWEEFAAGLMERAENKIALLDRLVNSILDYTKMADKGTQEEEDEWLIRKFLYGISNVDPIFMFGLNEVNGSELFNRYWDKSTNLDPMLILKDRPLASIWLLASAKFGFPWAETQFNTIAAEWQSLKEQEEEFQAALTLMREQKKKNKRSAITSPDRPGRANHKRHKISPEKDDSEMSEAAYKSDDETMDEINRKKRSAPEATGETAGSNSADDSVSGSEADSSETESEGSKSHDQTAPAQDDSEDQTSQAQDDSDDDDSDIAVDQDDGDAHPSEEAHAKKSQRRTRFEDEVSVESSPGQPPLKQPPSLKNSAKTHSAPSTPASHSPKPSRHSTPSSDKNPNPKPNPKPHPQEKEPHPESYAEAARLPESVLNDEQKVRRLVQVDIDGLPFSTVVIVNVNTSMSWQGLELEQVAQDRKDKNVRVCLENRMAMLIRKAIADAMNETSYDLTLMPMADGNYKKKQLWIRSAKALKQAIGIWSDMRDYINPTGTSNAFWFHKKPEEARERKLRIRMRFGCNAPIDVIRPILHTYFQLHASGSVFTSVLQFGSISWIGMLPYYPLTTNTKLLARQIMMILGFKIPIAVQAKWPSAVGTFNPNKTDQRWFADNNLQFLHIVTPTAYAKQVDRKMAALFSIERDVPKNQYPWGSPSQYVHHAKLCRDGQLSISWSNEVKSVLSRQQDTARAFLLISETIKCPINLTGMLSQARLSNFGAKDDDGVLKPQSLLKVLWSIKCTPDVGNPILAAMATDHRPNRLTTNGP